MSSILSRRVSTKSRAPSPPDLKDSQGFSQWCPGNPHLTMEQDTENDKELSLTVVLPGGVEKTTVVHGSKPLMDLLVTLCAKYHLNPSSHTLELVTANRNHIKLKPNALIGSLDAEKILLKPKGEDKNKKTGPHMPEATVRMVINYKMSQKTILRVNPRIPLAEFLPAICEKCEFDIETTVLLKDVQSLAPLDLSSSLNDYAIREVYARDTKGPPASPVSPGSPTSPVTPGKDKNQKEQENKGLFSKFRRSRKKSEQQATVSAPASPMLVSKPRPLSMALPSTNSSPISSPTSPLDVPKKRRAPQPPVLVSQSLPPDLSTRRRLSSELDSDQMTGVSCGSSAESTLKRTKRKAPPPPTSPSAIVQESLPQERSLQVDTGANTLEEIMEQEETTASVMSDTANKTQEDCSGVTTSPDVVLPPPFLDVEIQSKETVEADGEDQSCDLSSDGNRLETTVDDFSRVENYDDSVFSEMGDTDNSHIQVEKAKTETLQELTNDMASPAALSVSRPAGEDAQVQTDFPPLPDDSQQHKDDSVSELASSAESAEKRDMGTLTNDLDTADLENNSCRTAATTQTASSSLTKMPSLSATDLESKPRPSNEVTRDYIPKVGMTTYTIVPQKSLEKLRYFEVALTLEAPPQASGEKLDIGSLRLDDNVEQIVPSELKEKSESHPAPPREDALNNATSTQHTVINRKPESTHPTSPTTLGDSDKFSLTANGASEAGSPAEVKEIKIPPTTKPKPGSFRMAQHKRTTGYYVTSAAEKSLSVSFDSGQKEAQRKPSVPSPPLSPHMQCHEEATEARNTQMSPKQEESSAAIMRLSRQSSLPSREPSYGLSLEKLRSFAAPRPYSSTTPSPFAQAVSSAVKKSHFSSLRTKSPTSTKSPHTTPSRSPSSAVQSKGLSKLQECENMEMNSDGHTQQGDDEAQSFNNEIVQVDTENHP